MSRAELASPVPVSRSAHAIARRASDGARSPVVPDFCNMGVTLRVLLPLNAAAVVMAGIVGAARGDWLARLLDIVLLLEPALLLSLATLCGLRRWSTAWPRPLQWVTGLGLPALITLGLAWFVAHLLHPQASPVAVAAWAGACAVGAAGLAALAFEYFRLRAVSLSPSVSEARLQALQARIRPHFLFNSLNTVLGLMRSDPRRAEYKLENLADLFRVFMRDSRELVPLDEEVVICQQYLAIEQLRLGDRLQVRWQIEQMPGDALLPPLLLQPLVENAVHHGIEPRETPGEVLIAITRRAERVHVEIVNPEAVAQPARPGNQMALSNVRERLSLLYDIEAELKTVEADGLFRLILEFPYRKERRRRDDRRHHPFDR